MGPRYADDGAPNRIFARRIKRTLHTSWSSILNIIEPFSCINAILRGEEESAPRFRGSVIKNMHGDGEFPRT